MTDGPTTRHLLDGVEVVEEGDGQDPWQARYVHEDGIDHPRVMDRADQADVNGNQSTAEVLRFATTSGRWVRSRRAPLRRAGGR